MVATRASELRHEAADRQAFGATYGRPNALKARTDLVKSGTLRLAPHPDWSGDVTDWVADPFGDRNWRFQHHTLRWINPLRWSALDGDEDSRREWIRIVRSWAEANLPPRRRRGEFAWKDMADGNRALQLALGSRLVSDEDTWFIPLLEVHRDWLLDEKNLVQGNHGLHQLTGLFVVSSVLDDAQAIESCVHRLEQHLYTVFDEEGGNDEASIGYHILNVSWWQSVSQRLTFEGYSMSQEAERRLEAAGGVIAHLAQPDGGVPQIGDGPRRSVKRGMHPAVDFLASAGEEGQAPEADSFVLNRGYATMRSGWGQTRPLSHESHGVLRFGRPGGGHAHHDLASLHIYAAGRRWLIDSGFHSYQSKDPIRRHLNSREAHNVPLVRWGKYDLATSVSLDRAELTSDYDDFVLTDPGYSGVTLTRRVVYLKGPDCWVVWDRAEGTKPLRLVQQWHTEVGVSPRVHDRGFDLHGDGSSFTMTWVGPQPKRQRHQAKGDDLRGWIGTQWKTLEPANLLTAEAASDRPEIVLVAGASAPRDLAVVRSFLNSSGVLTLRLMRGPRVWHVQIPADDVDVRELERQW